MQFYRKPKWISQAHVPISRWGWTCDHITYTRSNLQPSSTRLDSNHVLTMVHFYHQCSHWYSSHFELDLSIEWSSWEQAFNKGTWNVFLPKTFNLSQSFDFHRFIFHFDYRHVHKDTLTCDTCIVMGWTKTLMLCQCCVYLWFFIH
jgi:hypothetical protein